MAIVKEQRVSKALARGVTLCADVQPPPGLLLIQPYPCPWVKDPSQDRGQAGETPGTEMGAWQSCGGTPPPWR